MDVVSSKTKLSKFKPESFQLKESFGTSVDMRVPTEPVVSVFGVEFYGNPVVPRVMHWLFIASATYISYHFVCSCRTD